MKDVKKIAEADRLWRAASELEDRGRIVKAVRLYRQAAELGDTSAQVNLGNLLDDKVSPPNPREAIYWYKRAVKSGNYLGARNLAVHYKNLENQRWHIYWLRVAEEMGDSESKKLYRNLMRTNARKKKRTSKK